MAILKRRSRERLQLSVFSGRGPTPTVIVLAADKQFTKVCAHARRYYEYKHFFRVQ